MVNAGAPLGRWRCAFFMIAERNYVTDTSATLDDLFSDRVTIP